MATEKATMRKEIQAKVQKIIDENKLLKKELAEAKQKHLDYMEEQFKKYKELIKQNTESVEYVKRLTEERKSDLEVMRSLKKKLDDEKQKHKETQINYDKLKREHKFSEDLRKINNKIAEIENDTDLVYKDKFLKCKELEQEKSDITMKYILSPIQTD